MSEFQDTSEDNDIVTLRYRHHLSKIKDLFNKVISERESIIGKSQEHPVLN